MFLDRHWEVMTQWEKDFVSSVHRECDHIGCRPTEKQQKILDRIYDDTERRAARRPRRLEE